jgi:hypothetical protein
MVQLEAKGCLTFSKVLNFLCIILLLVDISFRVSNFGNGYDAFFFIMTFYLLLFTVVLFFAEISWKRVIIYVRFLDLAWGRGVLTLMISVLLFDENSR